MKVVPLSEAKAELSRYGHLCHSEPVVITVNGRPSFQLVPLEEDDDLIQQLIDQHPGFRDLLEKRLRGRTVSVATATRRLAGGERRRAQRS
ncbi:MAG: type II toxin-antitoxin system prevent-host-death family antitoxin [Candidatus Binatales bacterium]